MSDSTGKVQEIIENIDVSASGVVFVTLHGSPTYSMAAGTAKADFALRMLLGAKLTDATVRIVGTGLPFYGSSEGIQSVYLP